MKGGVAVLYWLAKLLLTALIRSGIVPVQVVGRKNLKGLKRCVIVGNHLDNADGPVLIASLPFLGLWFVIRDDFGEPIRSTLTRLLLMSEINRENPRRFQMEKLIRLRRSGKRLAMFPHGARGVPSGPPKDGFVQLAGKKVPIVPVSISGTLDLLRKECWRRELWRLIRRRRPPIKVTIHAPVCYDPEVHGDRQSFAVQVMTTIARDLEPKERGYYADKV